MRREAAAGPSAAEVTSAVAEINAALGRGAAWLAAATDNGRSFTPSPLGLYFARLWYFEKLYPLISTAAGLAACERAARGDAGAAPRG